MIRIAAVASSLLVCGLANAALVSVDIPITITPAGGSVINATDYCAANGGGNGTSGSPWRYNCIQAAVNAANPGDTVFLAGGNWRLDTADGNFVQINKAINFTGAGSGNTFDAYGHINNASGVDFCPTAGTSITCIYMTGTSYTLGASAGHACYLDGSYTGGCAHPAGILVFGQTTYPTGDTYSGTISNIFFDGSLATDGGDINALLVCLYCTGPVTIDNIRLLAFNAQAIGNGETQISPQFSKNVTIQNSLFAAAQSSIVNGHYTNAQTFQLTGGNGIGSNYLIKNNVIYEGTTNPIVLSGVTFTGNQTYNHTDSFGSSGFDPTFNFAGSQMGGPAVNYCPETGVMTGQCNGDADFFVTNNLFYAPGNGFAIGGGVNDPGTSGGLNNLQQTGNWIISGTSAIDSCTWHIFNDQGNCAGGAVGMTFNTSVDVNCNVSANDSLQFISTNNSIIGTASAHLDARGNAATIGCKLGNPWTGNIASIPINVYGFSAQKNYLQSPSNQYLTNANTISPTQTSNYCAGSGGAGTVTACATSGFTTPPTCSFTIGTMSGSTVPFTNTSFTAQYGAVQWLASTISTPPLSNDSRWSSNNPSFPNSAANTYVPPVSLSPVAHGNTVYMWVMDSVNHIGACGSTLVP